MAFVPSSTRPGFSLQREAAERAEAADPEPLEDAALVEAVRVGHGESDRVL